jgi:hypothetical protein
MGFLLSFFGGQYFKNKRERRRLEARADHIIDVLERKEENKQEFVSRSREIAQEIEEHGYTEELSKKDPNW